MPCAISRSRLTLPSALRSAANCGSANTRCSCSSLTPRCMVGGGQQHTLARCRPASGAHRWAVEQPDVTVGIRWQRSMAGAQRPTPSADAAPIDLGHLAVRPVGEAAVALHPAEDEGREDQEDHDAQEQAVVGADEFEHAGPWGTRGPGSPGDRRPPKQRRRTAAVRLRSTRRWPVPPSGGPWAAMRTRILSQRLGPRLRPRRMVGAEGLEPPTYAWVAPSPTELSTEGAARTTSVLQRLAGLELRHLAA